MSGMKEREKKKERERESVCVCTCWRAGVSLSLSSEITQAKSEYFIIARINETKLYVYGGEIFFSNKKL